MKRLAKQRPEHVEKRLFNFVEWQMRIEQIKLHPSEIEQSRRFADCQLAARSHWYKRRSPTVDEKKFWSDCRDGKLAEFGVQKYIRGLGYDCTDPDCEIHDRRDPKIWHDLTASMGERKLISVKSTRWYPAPSWVVQDVDPLVFDVMACCLLPTSGDSLVEIYAFLPRASINSLLSDMKNGNRTKKAIYYKDINDKNSISLPRREIQGCLFDSELVSCRSQ